MTHRRSALSAAAIFGLGALLAPSRSHAQTSLERFERQLEQIQRQTRLQVNPDVPVGQRTYLDYGGFLTFNFFAIDDLEQHTHILRQTDLVGYARLNIDGAHEFFLRARTSHRDFNTGDDFDGDGDETIWPTVEQAYYRFDLARHLSAYHGRAASPNNLTAQVGRNFVYWANGLVLAETLDGGLVNLTLGNFEAQFLGGVTAHDTVDIDSSRPRFDQNTSRGFFGAMASYQLGKHRPFVYGLVQRDYNDDKYRLRQPPTEFEYDSWYVGVGGNGSIGDRLVYAIEAVYEGGDNLTTSFEPNTLLPIPQFEENIDAWAVDVRLDYLLADERRTRLSAELIIASGDPDRIHTTNTFGGNIPGTEDEAFNAWGLLNTGLAFSPNVSNLIDLRLGVSTFPLPNSSTFRRLQVGLDVHTLFKLQEDAPIDETTEEDSRFLGVEPDLFVNWQITSDVSFALRYGVFFPGNAIVADEHPRNFFFAGLTFAF
jgi:hypothetical protein